MPWCTVAPPSSDSIFWPQRENADQDGDVEYDVVGVLPEKRSRCMPVVMSASLVAVGEGAVDRVRARPHRLLARLVACGWRPGSRTCARRTHAKVSKDAWGGAVGAIGAGCARSRARSVRASMRAASALVRAVATACTLTGTHSERSPRLPTTAARESVASLCCGKRCM